MGRGNWFPGNRLEDCDVAYVNILDEDDDGDGFYWIEFEAELRCVLGESFYWKPSPRDAGSRFDSAGRDDNCIAYNGLYGVFLDGQGDMHHMGIGVLTRDDAPAFAKARQYEFARKLFNKLQDRYELSVRTSAWTSSPRIKGQLQ